MAAAKQAVDTITTEDFLTKGSLEQNSSTQDAEKSDRSDDGSHDIENSAKAKTAAATDPTTNGEDRSKPAAMKMSELPPDHPMHPSQFPEGGPGWMVVFGAFCAIFASFGWINCIGVFQDYYQLHLLSQYSPSTISWISSVEAAMLFIWGPLVGKVFDNYGPRYLLLFGTFMHVFGIMMTSLSTEYYQILLAQAICSPIGASCLFYTSMNCASTWFMRRRGLALGIVATGSSLGGVLLPIAVFHLLPEVGFPWTMRIIGFIFLGVLIISNLTIKSRIPPRPVPFEPMEFVRPLKEPLFAMNVFSSFCVFLPLLVPINYVIVQGGTIGMSQRLQNYLVSILNAASIFGRVLPGHFADVFGRFNLQIIMSALAGITCLALWIPAKTNAVVIVFAAFYGFASGAFVSLAPTVVAQITKDLSKIGVRNGTTFFIMAFAALTGSPIAGALITRWNGSFTGLQLFCGIMQIGGSICFIITKGYATGWKWFTKI